MTAQGESLDIGMCPLCHTRHCPRQIHDIITNPLEPGASERYQLVLVECRRRQAQGRAYDPTV